MKIYTKTGDDGTTGLFGGERVSKAHARIETYGTVDELNAIIGTARAEMPTTTALSQLLEEIQKSLFVLGADLATPVDIRTRYEIPRIQLGEIEWLESEIDNYDQSLPALKQFILPGGTKAAAQLHVARTVARRAERLLVALAQHEILGDYDIQFLNRLSDLLFVLARFANQTEGVADVEWDGKTQLH